MRGVTCTLNYWRPSRGTTFGRREQRNSHAPTKPWELTLEQSFWGAIWQDVSGYKAGHMLSPQNYACGTYSKGIMREAHKIYI